MALLLVVHKVVLSHSVEAQEVLAEPRNLLVKKLKISLLSQHTYVVNVNSLFRSGLFSFYRSCLLGLHPWIIEVENGSQENFNVKHVGLFGLLDSL